MLRSVRTADPAPKLDTYAVYAAAVAPDPTFNIIMSFEEMKLLVNVNDTAVAPANAALFIVIWPADLFSVTPVDLLLRLRVRRGGFKFRPRLFVVLSPSLSGQTSALANW